MQKRHLLLFIMLLWLGAGNYPARGQDAGEQSLQRIQRSFAQGDAGALLAQGADRVEITLGGVSTLYSRAQALYVMRGFFQEHPPARFTFEAPSKTPRDWFVEGQYWYGTDAQRMRVYVRLQQRKTRWELRSIRIEPYARR